MIFILKILISASVIAFTSWLAGKKPELAGFIIALPLASLLALAFAHFEHGNEKASIEFAKSILIAVPVSWLFFLPFFLTDKYNYGFWVSYIIGILLLIAGYFIHKIIMSYFVG
jgi:hypothetical protein